MTPEQRARLDAVSRRIAEVAIRDADPDNWTGGDQPLSEMDRPTRGDAQWCRKTAVQTVALLARVETLLNGGPRGASDDPEAEIAQAEKAANAALERVLGGKHARA